MTSGILSQLSRRERQLMDALFAIRSGTSAEIRERLTDDPGYDSVRVTLRNLEKKGFVVTRREGPRNVYQPAIELAAATDGALQHLVRTFFAGSRTKAILALLDMPDEGLPPDQLEALARRIEAAREEEGHEPEAGQ